MDPSIEVHFPYSHHLGTKGPAVVIHGWPADVTFRGLGSMGSGDLDKIMGADISMTLWIAEDAAKEDIRRNLRPPQLV